MVVMKIITFYHVDQYSERFTKKHRDSQYDICHIKKLTNVT